jgi:hypothetical protein
VPALKANQLVASHSRGRPLSDLERAGCQVLPQGVSIALSIRELVRQGYLLSALILVRPLMERACIVNYLVATPAAVALWWAGWKHGKRPSLKQMLVREGSPVDVAAARSVCELFGHVVHGDPASSAWNLVPVGDAEVGYASSKMLGSPELCDMVCDQTASWLLTLVAGMVSVFPEAEGASGALVGCVEAIRGADRPRTDRRQRGAALTKGGSMEADGWPEIRLACAEYIGEIGARRTLTALHEHLECEHDELEALTVDELRTILAADTRHFRLHGGGEWELRAPIVAPVR